MNDQGIELRIKETTATSYPKTALANISSLPATGASGSSIDVTVFSDTIKKNIPDRPDLGDMDYTYLYSETAKSSIEEFCDGTEKDILIKYPDGTGVEYKGICKTWRNEVSVGGKLECTLNTKPQSEPQEIASTALSAKIATN